MRKKRSEGKPCKIDMMASADKFLRICYASVKRYLDFLNGGSHKSFHIGLTAASVS